MAKVKKSMRRVGAAVQRARAVTKFRNLPAKDQRRIAGIIVGGMRKMGWLRSGYKPVTGPDQLNRGWIHAETGPETKYLTADERNRLIALARNAARNTESFEGILNQLETGVIGIEGGKAVFNFPAEFEDAQKKIKAEFSKWAKSAEYFDDANLQRVLSLVLRTLMIGGDCALVFDWDVTKYSTGQIIGFEPDCIGNLEDGEFEKHFPGCRQYQGIIKNDAGKTVGVVCSWSERGRSRYRLFDDKGRRAAWTMIKPVGVAWEDSQFTVVRVMKRINQMRGASSLWPVLGTIVDLSEYQGYEVQAAKKNAQTIAQVTQQEEQNEGELAEEMDPDAEAPIEGEEGSAADAGQDAKGEDVTTDDGMVDLELDHIEGAGTIYDVLPPGVKMELLDTKHPNTNLVEFSKYLRGGSGYVVGLGNVHATGKADSSYSAAMAEMLLSSQAFRKLFHELEIGVLDWALSNWSRMAQAFGLIPSDDELPDNWRHACVTWQQPPERAIDPVKEQQALALGLKNGTILYSEKWGPDWRSKLKQFATEIRAFADEGVPHPALETVSGAEKVMPQNANSGEEGAGE